MAEEKQEKPKFNVGDKVWFIAGRAVIEKEIRSVFFFGSNIFYGFLVNTITEKYNGGDYLGTEECDRIVAIYVFGTKKQLIDSL